MRKTIFILGALASLTVSASAGGRYQPVCETHTFYKKGAIGQTAYKDPCFYGSHARNGMKLIAVHGYGTPTHVYKKPRVKHTQQLAYKNPPASSIYNHPARGMKHKRDDNSVNLHEGTPRAYQLLGTSLFYGPYLYSPRDREYFN